MGYKVLIPTAGIGARLGDMTKYINKSLINISNRPAISRIIEMFPGDCEFVIPIGYKGHLVKEFLGLAYPDRKFYFTDVYPYEGDDSGLGLSILTCENLLQEPFVFCSCDTLVVETIPEPYQNWMGYGERDQLKEYRTIGITRKKEIDGIYEKGTFQNEKIKPYIGLAGIYNYNLFWEAMKKGGMAAIRQGESYGLQALILNYGVKACGFTWYDTGVEKELAKTREYYTEEDAPNILEKANEAIWFMDKQVIKFSDNINFIEDRVKRAEILKNYVPAITGVSKHMYAYEYVDGTVMSKNVTKDKFAKLLSFSKEFWKVKELTEEEKKEFTLNCREFYKNKTYSRIDAFYENFHKTDEEQEINGVPTPKLSELMDKIDWNSLEYGLPGQFHGDYHFENIIYNEKTDSFCFLDWRQNFGSSIDIGDIYYDLGKLLHGLIICHELIAKDCYEIKWSGNRIQYDFYRKSSLVECEQYFYEWLKDNFYDINRVKLITALIYLNIAALHHYPYGLLLYSLGKKMLFDIMNL